jgi:hypothetical protein
MLLGAVTGVLLSSSGLAQAWSLLSPTTSPPGRDNHVMCNDTNRNVVVMYGGLSSIGDTWEWDGATWTNANPVTQPPTVGYAGMSYDSSRKVCVLFGGRTVAARLNETWEYDGLDWKKINTTNSPPVRYGHAQCYDSTRRVTVVFSGFDVLPYHPDTWEYDGTDWKQVATTGPIGRIYPHMEFDFVRNKTVLFSGYATGATPSIDIQDTWEWDGTTWTEIKLACQPDARWGHSMAYVIGRGIVMYGGVKQVAPNNGTKGDTWVYNGTWSEVRPASPPAARRLHAMASDPKTQAPLLFGGSAGPAQTYLLDLGSFVSGVYEPYGAGCAGTAGIPSLGALGCNPPFIKETFTIELTNVPASSTPILVFGLSNTRWGGATLPMDLSFMGFTGCSLLASLNFTLPMTVTGSVARVVAPLSNDNRLVGFTFFNQAFVPDASANSGGATLSNAVAATVGRR